MRLAFGHKLSIWIKSIDPKYHAAKSCTISLFLSPPFFKILSFLVNQTICVSQYWLRDSLKSRTLHTHVFFVSVLWSRVPHMAVMPGGILTIFNKKEIINIFGFLEFKVKQVSPDLCQRLRLVSARMMWMKSWVKPLPTHLRSSAAQSQRSAQTDNMSHFLLTCHANVWAAQFGLRFSREGL